MSAAPQHSNDDSESAVLNLEDTPEIGQIRDAVRSLCEDFPGEYWRELDRERRYPTEFIKALTDTGFLGVLIPEDYGGSGLGIRAACAILEEIHASGGNASAGHAQMYIMGTILRHGSEAQKRQWLPGIAKGELRLPAAMVTVLGIVMRLVSLEMRRTTRSTATSVLRLS